MDTAVAKHQLKCKEFEKETYLKKYEFDQKIELEAIRIEKESIDIHKKTWDATFEIEKLSKKHDLDKVKIQNDHDQKIKEKELKLITENIDADVLKFNSM